MNSESVDLIATDPPFNKGRDFHATPESLADGASFQDRWSWERDVKQDWIDQITDDFPKLMTMIQSSRFSYGDGMGAFLCFMAVRLLEMRRVLKKTGSLYLHCDSTASHYLKQLMDGIFGADHFQNEIVWGYRTGGVSKKRWPRKHDTLLFYRKSNAYVHNPATERIYYSRPFFTSQVDNHGKYYADVYVRDVWEDIKPVLNLSLERFGYPTQKPLALYERIIRASSNRDDMVLDPFCGCATTLIAAERLDRQWVGIDIWDKARQAVIDRLKKERLSAEEFQEWLNLRGEITYTTVPPTRADDGAVAVPSRKTKLKVTEPKGRKMSRKEMYDFLLSKNGPKCQGCDRVFDDPRYLELDHNTPRSDGGLNHISNWVLLCGPCNKLKSTIYTLSGLRRQNKHLGYMAK